MAEAAAAQVPERDPVPELSTATEGSAKSRRSRRRWYVRPEGRSVYAAVPHNCWLVQQAHSSTQELVYRFLARLKPKFHDSNGDPVVQASYAQIARGCNFPWRTTAGRNTAELIAKHSIRLFELKHSGGKRASGEGNTTSTYYVIPAWKRVLEARRSDAKIGKDKLGRAWIIGRSKRFLTPEQIDEWKLDDDYGRAPIPAYVPIGGEDEYTAWLAETAKSGDSQQQLVPPMASPPGESPPLPQGEPEIPPGADDTSIRGRGKKVPAPPDALWEFAVQGCKLRPGYPYVWKFLSEMRKEAAKYGYALPVQTLVKMMLIQFRKLEPERPQKFAYYYTVRELINERNLEAENCPRIDAASAAQAS